MKNENVWGVTPELTEDETPEKVEDAVTPKDNTTDEESDNKADVKSEESVSNEGGESLEELQERLAKVEADRDNYKNAVLISKKKDREISEKKDLSKKEIKDLGDDGVKAIETNRVNEKQAISSFIENNQEYVDDDSWKNLLSNYISPKESTQDGVKLSLENAHLVTLHKAGKLVTQAEMDKKVLEAQTNSQVDSITSSSGNQGTGSRSAKPSDNKSAVEMSAKFSHSDAEKVEGMDDSREAIIDINNL